MSEIGELEALAVIIGYQMDSEVKEERQSPIMALLSVIEVLMDYHTILEDDEADKTDLEERAVQSIYEQIHNWIVHGGTPLTDAERIAQEDQEIAEFSDKLKDILGVKIDFDSLLEKKEEEKTEDGDE